jgi:hypothetical protein
MVPARTMTMHVQGMSPTAVVVHPVRASRRYASTKYWARDSMFRSDWRGLKPLVARGECTVY